MLADYVTLEQGTGAVHTAPSHGADDFHTGVKYGLDPTCNVDAAGRLHHGLSEYEGKTVFEANKPIIDLLRARGVLMGESKITHSYPHCWRCHNPVIFRATEQWFIGMESPLHGSTLRQRALEEIKKVSPETEVIIMTGHASIETAMDAVRLGAFDYITKPCKLTQIETILRKVVERRELKNKIAATAERGPTNGRRS